jgi:cell division protein FtsN
MTGEQPVSYDITAINTASVAKPYSEARKDETYRIQVGAYKNQKYAADSFNRLQNAGLNPAYERYQDFNRVIITGIHQEELDMTLQKLSALGFSQTVVKRSDL